jgi:hypothetical protein
MIWLSALVPIAEIAERLLRIFIKGDSAEGPPFTGPVTWSIDAKKQVIALNKGKEEVGLFFSRTNTDATVTALQPLKSGEQYNVTKDLQDFARGTVTIAPMAEGTSEGLTRLLTFAIRWLAPAMAVSIVRGVSFKYERTANGFVAKVDTTGPKITSVDLRVGDPNGCYVSVKSDFELTAGQTHEIKIPPGVNLDPMAREVDLTIEVDQAAFEEAVAERRALATPSED